MPSLNGTPHDLPPDSPDSKIGVLLLHGLTGTPSEMRSLTKRFTNEGYVVEVPLLPGHGKGHKELLATNWKDWVAGAKEAYINLAGQTDKVFIVGLSMGCLLAVMLATELKIQTSGLILLSPAMGYHSNKTTWLRYLLPLYFRLSIFHFLHSVCYWAELPPYGIKDERLQRIITRSIESAKKGETNEFGLFRTYVGSLHQNQLLIDLVKQRAHLVECPAIIVQSLEDTISGSRNATELGHILGSKDKTVILMSGCDHVMTVDLRKHDIAELAVRFIHDVAQGSNTDALSRALVRL